MNNKGMAITTIIYSIILLLSLSMFLVLGILRSEYTNDKQYIADLREELNDLLKGTNNESDNVIIDESGANKPILASNMIPVYYDETNEVWKKADANNSLSFATYKLGDVNGDGEITAIDRSLLSRYLKNEGNLSQIQILAADVDGDGVVTENDGNLIKNCVSGAITTFPAGAPLEEKQALVGLNKWYDYNDKMWANAVTVTSTNRTKYLNAEPGTTIPMDDITTMWVWIPRFNAVTPSNYNGGTKDNPGAINVTFVKANETAIDAFTFGTKELSGFWYAKFETSHSTLSSENSNNLGCTNETCSNANGIIIKPNVVSLRYNNISNMFYASRSMEQTGNSFGFVSSEVDTHMSKNNEWGAVAYLTQSIYGRCTSSTSCTEIGINNNSRHITGYGAPAGSATSVTNGAYNTTLGKDASTTGTIYGIYDMSGGVEEYVMGVYNNAIKSSGFSNMPNEKYYNNYTSSSYTGHALTETAGWYKDSSSFGYSDYPWFRRGGDYKSDISSGIFNYYSVAVAFVNSSFRIALINE